jgi:multisubunit Na+/H+ antiporter MnhB subunit
VIRRIGGWLAAALAFGVLCSALLDLPETPTGLADEAHRLLHESGVSNPVTAVLLNYRSYDTLLEVAVLLLAIVAVWSLRSISTASFAEPAGPILAALLHFLLPLLLLTSGYLLWIGAFAPGGAFQGGALLGGAIVLLLLGGGIRRQLLSRRALLRAGLWTGLAVFVAVGLAVMPDGGRFLEYPKSRAKDLILLVETAALLSIGLTLGALFFGGRPTHGSDPPSAGDS